MTGEELYEMYVNEMKRQRVGVDPWEDLPVTDQNAWNEMAEKLQRKDGE